MRETATPGSGPDLALRAAYEVESIATVLQRHFQQRVGLDGEDLFVLGLAIRLESLASVVMDGIGGEPNDIEDARARLTGPAAVRAAAPA